MRKLAIIALLAATAALAAPTLFSGATASKWSVTKGGSAVGTITLLTSPNATRAEWKATGAKGAPVIFLGGQGKVWLRDTGGDVELATISATTLENSVVPALLLPFTTSSGDKAVEASGKVTSYRYRGSKATYRYDAKGIAAVEVDAGGTKYTLTRTSLAASSADASNFVIRPKKGAASRLARLSGDLLGPSSSGVSSTAGGRGVGKGMKLNDGGDYDALLRLENRDEAWRKNLDTALSEFQRDGKVGRAGRSE